MADQARREDPQYWSGPTYAHGATERCEQGDQGDPMQEDMTELREHRQQRRAARKETRRQAESRKHDATTPSSQHPSDQCREQLRTLAEEHKEANEEARGKAAEGSDEMEREYPKKVRRGQKERVDRSNSEREQTDKDFPAELFFLLSKIISYQGNLERMGDKIDESGDKADEPRSATKVCCFVYGVAPCLI